MGQKIGRLPDSWQELMEERDRVLHWSSEVLARVDDNITNEDTFLMDYDNDRIDAKVDLWLGNLQYKWQVALSRFPNAPERYRNTLKNEIAKVDVETRNKMRRDYQKAYANVRKFTKKVDILGMEERQIHLKIQSIELNCQNDVKKFSSKFGPLRKRVFKNLRRGEKMIFQDKKLKTQFTKKVYDIDHKYMAECKKRCDKLIRDFEKFAEVSR